MNAAVAQNTCQSLPSSLAEIASVIGEEGAMLMVRSFGGTRIFIPREVRPEHRLTAAIGMDLSEALSRHFGGETLTVARNTKSRRANRNREIIQEYDRGVSVRDLARINELTERQIYTILGSAA